MLTCVFRGLSDVTSLLRPALRTALPQLFHVVHSQPSSTRDGPAFADADDDDQFDELQHAARGPKTPVRAARSPLPVGEYYHKSRELEIERSELSRGQQRYTGVVEERIAMALASDMVLKERLVERYGFTVHSVRLSRDRRTATVLWDCFPGNHSPCSLQLPKMAARMRQSLSRTLSSKSVPFLDFQHDHLDARQQKAVLLVDFLAREQQDAQQQEAGAGDAGDARGTATPTRWDPPLAVHTPTRGAARKDSRFGGSRS